jgi:hypothetical protein
MAVIRKTKNKNNKNNKTKKHIKKYNKSRKIQRGGSEKAAGNPGKPRKSSKWPSFSLPWRKKELKKEQREVVYFENPSVKATTQYRTNPLLAPESESASNKVHPASVAPIKSPLTPSDAMKRSTRKQTVLPGLVIPVRGLDAQGLSKLRKASGQLLSRDMTLNTIKNMSKELQGIPTEKLYNIDPTTGLKKIKNSFNAKTANNLFKIASSSGMNVNKLTSLMGIGRRNLEAVLLQQHNAVAKARQGAMQAATNYNQRHSLNFGEETSKLNRAAILAAEEKNPYLTIEPADPKSVEENDGYMKFG